MSEAERDVDALRVLAAMPFLDRLELAAVAGVSEGTAHNALSRLQSDGLVDCIRHAAPLNASTRRWHVTADGLHRLDDQTGTSLSRLLRTHPVSAHWQRLLLARLDAVAVIYRLASTLGVPHRFRWYRSAALDAAMSLADGKTIGIIRQGATTDRTAFADRVRWLPNTQQALPRALLALMPDEARLRQARKLLARYPGPVFLAPERDVANSEADDRIWRITSSDAVLSLDEAIAHMHPGGGLPTEPPLTRLALPQDPSIPEEAEETPGHLLPAVLKPAEKGVLDCLADWPWIAREDLSDMIGLSPSRTSSLCLRLTKLGLVSRISLQGRRRLALSRRGLTLLARRDRSSVSTAVKRWGVETAPGEVPSSWRSVPGSRSRPLARTIEHTEAVHRFMGALVSQANDILGCRVTQVSPPHHAARYFRYGGRLRSIHPDAFGVVRVGNRTYPFFLEWERRASNPSTMAARLAPYLRYYSSSQPLDDHGRRPLVLVVFDDPLAEANFLGVARSEMERTGVSLPLWASYRERLESVGPLGAAWRNPDVLEPACAFR